MVHFHVLFFICFIPARVCAQTIDSWQQKGLSGISDNCRRVQEVFSGNPTVYYTKDGQVESAHELRYAIINEFNHRGLRTREIKYHVPSFIVWEKRLYYNEADNLSRVTQVWTDGEVLKEEYIYDESEKLKKIVMHGLDAKSIEFTEKGNRITRREYNQTGKWERKIITERQENYNNILKGTTKFEYKRTRRRKNRLSGFHINIKKTGLDGRTLNTSEYKIYSLLPLPLLVKGVVYEYIDDNMGSWSIKKIKSGFGIEKQNIHRYFGYAGIQYPDRTGRTTTYWKLDDENRDFLLMSHFFNGPLAEGLSLNQLSNKSKRNKLSVGRLASLIYDLEDFGKDGVPAMIDLTHNNMNVLIENPKNTLGVIKSFRSLGTEAADASKIVAEIGRLHTSFGIKLFCTETLFKINYELSTLLRSLDDLCSENDEILIFALRKTKGIYSWAEKPRMHEKSIKNIEMMIKYLSKKLNHKNDEVVKTALECLGVFKIHENNIIDVIRHKLKKRVMNKNIERKMKETIAKLKKAK